MSMFPVPGDADIQVFSYASGFTANIQYSFLSTWRKPRGVSMVYIFAVGGGGGGGYGNGAAGSGSGGGGGASSPQVTGLFPAIFIPDNLYVIVGRGGSGGKYSGSPVSATAGTSSVVLIKPDNNLRAHNILLTTSSVLDNSGQGANGTGTGGASGGSISSGPSAANNMLCGMGIVQYITGQFGASGSYNTNGGSITLPTTGLCVTGGAGGAGSNASAFNGGAFLSASGSYVSSIRPLASSARGSNGFLSLKPFYSFGGCGGGTSSSINTNGANGGRGGPGSGGGGGGAFANTGGGDGGDGGDGLVIICSW